MTMTIDQEERRDIILSSIASAAAPWNDDIADDALDDMLSDDENPKPYTRVRFVIDSESKEDWLVGKYNDLVRRAANAKARAAQYELEASRLIAHFGPDILTWVQTETKGKKKSLKLDSGTIGYRDVQDRIEIPNNTKDARKQLVDWVKDVLMASVSDEDEDVCGIVKTETTESVSVSALKERLELRIEEIADKDTGEVVEVPRVVIKGTDVVVPMAVIKAAQEPFIRGGKDE
jgi:hypothetical protein